MEEDLKKICATYTLMDVTFDQLMLNETSKGTVVMVVAPPNLALIQLQKVIHETLSIYGENIKESFAKYESEFLPHITIGRQLSGDQLVMAKQELVEPVTCKAQINEVVLTVVSEMIIEEMNNSDNRTVVKLGYK
ncbi:MAG: 2'-5' RNA ligase family protein [bacterium]|nr:2'-5' RNA ligase family protein [bacterium]